MPSTDPWPIIQSERAALALDLVNLHDDQWNTPSLCEGWTVRDTVAHLTASAKVSPGTYIAKMALAGFNSRRVRARDIRMEAGKTPMDTLTRFQAVVDSSKHPPGPPDAWLGELVVHAEDIRRPLGLIHAYPLHALISAADIYKDSNLVVGAKKRIEGLHLRAVDSTWSHGSGPEVVGGTRALLMAMAGRKVFLDDLQGDGVAILRERR